MHEGSGAAVELQCCNQNTQMDRLLLVAAWLDYRVDRIAEVLMGLSDQVCSPVESSQNHFGYIGCMALVAEVARIVVVGNRPREVHRHQEIFAEPAESVVGVDSDYSSA